MIIVEDEDEVKRRDKEHPEDDGEQNASVAAEEHRKREAIPTGPAYAGQRVPEAEVPLIAAEDKPWRAKARADGRGKRVQWLRVAAAAARERRRQRGITGMCQVLTPAPH